MVENTDNNNENQKELEEELEEKFDNHPVTKSVKEEIEEPKKLGNEALTIREFENWKATFETNLFQRMDERFPRRKKPTETVISTETSQPKTPTKTPNYSNSKSEIPSKNPSVLVKKEPENEETLDDILKRYPAKTRRQMRQLRRRK